jgi:hypothetical protein
VKVKFKEGVEPGPITLKAETPPKGFKVKTEPIPVGKDTATVTYTTIGLDIHTGQTGTLIVTGTMKKGKETMSGFVPAIPYEITK